MTINIHGKEYKTVAERVVEFKETHPEWSIESDIVKDDGTIVQIKSVVRDETGRVRGTGYAEEVRGSTNINKTSALENCETSAIGRALACIGLGGTQYASANEVTDAIIQQAVMESQEYLLRHMAAVRENLTSVYDIRNYIAMGQLSLAAEAWYELPEEVQKALWVAPTKGGIFTTKERETMKNEFSQYRSEK